MNTPSAIKYYAIRKSDDSVIAEGEGYLQCSDAAKKASGWDMAPGTVAPYFITTDRWFADQSKSAANQFLPIDGRNLTVS